MTQLSAFTRFTGIPFIFGHAKDLVVMGFMVDQVLQNVGSFVFACNTFPKLQYGKNGFTIPIQVAQSG